MKNETTPVALSIYSKICTAHGRPINPNVADAISASPDPVRTASAIARCMDERRADPTRIPSETACLYQPDN